jgi:hypothetical protein
VSLQTQAAALAGLAEWATFAGVGYEVRKGTPVAPPVAVVEALAAIAEAAAKAAESETETTTPDTESEAASV